MKVIRGLRAPRAAIAVLGCGCAAWPLHANLPDNGDPVPADVDPATLVDVTWTAVSDEEPNDHPDDSSVLPIESGAGFVGSGTLDGIGWDSSASTLAIEACGRTGSLVPDTEQGRYVADVDIYPFRVVDSGALCVRGELGTGDVAWDLVVFELDDCGVPVGPLTVEEDGVSRVLGFGAQDPSVSWGTPIPALRDYVLVVGGFRNLTAGEDANAPDRIVPYELAVSVVPASGDVADQFTCPSFPDGSAP